MTTHATIAIALLLAVTLVTVSYVSACYVRPFGACHKCAGTGRITNRLGRGKRYCPRCDSTGLRLRIGRHVWNYVHRLYRDGTR